MKKTFKYKNQPSKNVLEQLKYIEKTVTTAKNSKKPFIFILTKIEDISDFKEALKLFLNKNKDVKSMSHGINEWKLIW